ncbi:ABC transporter permease [Leucobacter sp. M11]|uniref:ABC transporter permease n=1 Tax=Leucobacter sp. M11 TaxID=2993565 RepID=UPI002D810F52|nr:ABC transporter permease [Leucobacter sp. M11]MEB4614370.1 ABC transporter permease [Leucobacter sp. M11]
MSDTELLNAYVTPDDEAADVRHGSGTLRYILKKAGGSVISLFMVVMLGFFAFRVLPGDPVAVLTRGREVTAQQVADLRLELGLDQPIWVQFWHYLTGLFQGDLGTSFVYHAPVTQLIGEYLWPTVLLMSVSLVFTILIGVWAGQKAAWNRGGFFDNSSTTIALIFWSMPAFWLGLLLLLAFSGTGIFPSAGMVTAGSSAAGFALVWDVVRHLALPTVTLVAVSYAQYALVMRSSLLEEMNADYLVTARAKGLPEDTVRRRHALPNALLPTVTIVFLQIAGLISGAVTVETVFSWPGLGFLTYQAIQGPDFPLLQGTFVVFSSIVILMNFVADLVYRAIDPRVRAA